MESSRFGPRLSALVGLRGSAFPLSLGHTQTVLDQLLGVSISSGAIAAIRSRLAACLEQPVEEALQAARLQPVVYMDETGAPIGDADGGNPDGRRGWLWVLMTPVLTVFTQGLSPSRAAAMELLGSAFAGTVVSDRFSAYNQLPAWQRRLCWAHLIGDLTAMAERPGASVEIGAALLDLQQQLLSTGTAGRTARSRGPNSRIKVGQSEDRSRPPCSEQWISAASGVNERHGPTPRGPAASCWICNGPFEPS